MDSCLVDDHEVTGKEERHFSEGMRVIRSLLVSLYTLLLRISTTTNLNPQLKRNLDKALGLVKELVKEVDDIIEGRVKTPDTESPGLVPGGQSKAEFGISTGRLSRAEKGSSPDYLSKVQSGRSPNSISRPEAERSPMRLSRLQKRRSSDSQLRVTNNHTESPDPETETLAHLNNARFGQVPDAWVKITLRDDPVCLPPLADKGRKCIKRHVPRQPERDKRKEQLPDNHIPVQIVELKVDSALKHAVDVPGASVAFSPGMTLKDAIRLKRVSAGVKQNLRPRSDTFESDIVQRNICKLKQEIDTRITIADFMFEKYVFSYDDSKLVRLEVTRTKANDTFFDILNDNTKSNKYQIFLAALEHDYPQVVRNLK